MVGYTSFALADESRDNRVFGAPLEKRELSVHAWYPGSIPEGQPRPRIRRLWEELYSADRDLVAVITSYLRGVKTHSFEDIPISSAQSHYAVLVFSHAMVSFPEQNALLMEHLASHGYVVLAVGHTYTSMRTVFPSGGIVYPNFARINSASTQRRIVDEKIATRIEQAGSAEERFSLQIEGYESSDQLNKIMPTWVADLGFVIDSISTPGEKNL